MKKLTVAMDVGTVVNPDGVRAQIEGSVLWGASLAMLEKATMKNGGIEQTNFDSYTPMRMSQMPELDISIIANGEPAVGLRRAGGDGHRAGDRQRHLQCGRRARPLAADHRGSGESGDEDLIGEPSVQTETMSGACGRRFFVRDCAGHPDLVRQNRA